MAADYFGNRWAMPLIACNQQRRVELMNPVAEQLTGWSLEEAKGRRLETIFCTIDEETREPVKNPGAGWRRKDPAANESFDG